MSRVDPVDPAWTPYVDLHGTPRLRINKRHDGVHGTPRTTLAPPLSKRGRGVEGGRGH
jgi:hypothetical protein